MLFRSGSSVPFGFGCISHTTNQAMNNGGGPSLQCLSALGASRTQSVEALFFRISRVFSAFRLWVHLALNLSNLVRMIRWLSSVPFGFGCISHWISERIYNIGKICLQCLSALGASRTIFIAASVLWILWCLQCLSALGASRTPP